MTKRWVPACRYRGEVYWAERCHMDAVAAAAYDHGLTIDQIAGEEGLLELGHWDTKREEWRRDDTIHSI